MKGRWKKGVGAVAVVALGVTGGTFALHTEAPPYEVFGSPVERSAIEKTVAGTGIAEPMVTVAVGSQVTGQVQRIFADFNSVVTHGQILAQLDSRSADAQLRRSGASLRAAESGVLSARADRGSADADLASARANRELAAMELTAAELNKTRAEMLFRDGLVAATAVEEGRMDLQSARSAVLERQEAVDQAAGQIVSRDAALEQAYASLAQAEVDLEEARHNVDYTAIRSPMDGVVISREVDVGQTISAMTSAPTLFTVATDLSQMRVQVGIDEADIGAIGYGDPVAFTVDAYPNAVFDGQVQEIRLKASTAQNVVTYSVIVAFENPALQVKPGMTANVLITVGYRDGVLTVPNTALRYTPAGTDPGKLPVSDARNGWKIAGGAARLESPRFPVDESADEAVPTTAPTFSPVYMAGQEWQDSVKIRFEAVAPADPRPGRVWVMTDVGVPEMRPLILGLTDGSRTEVVSGGVKEGDLVVVGDTSNAVPEQPSSGTDGQRNVLSALSGGFGR